MATLLVLGSKPDPCLPASGSFDAVACANASGYSAARHGLPAPQFTVISSILFTGKNESNRLALKALSGLETARVYLFPRRPFRNKPWKQALHFSKLIRMSQPMAAMQLRRAGFHYDEIVCRSATDYLQAVGSLADNDPELRQLIAEKVPSVGVLAVALGLSDYRYDRIVLSGFSFEITHAHAANPLIAARGSSISRHAETDIATLRLIHAHRGCLYTSEPIVHHRTGLPLV